MITAIIIPNDAAGFHHNFRTNSVRQVFNACTKFLGKHKGSNTVSGEGFIRWHFEGGFVELQGNVKRVIGYRSK